MLERKFLFSLFRGLSQRVLAWKEAIMVFFNFMSLFAFFFFLNSLSRAELEMIGMIIFNFTLSQPFPTCFGLKKSHNGVF